MDIFYEFPIFIKEWLLFSLKSDECTGFVVSLVLINALYIIECILS